MKSKLSEWKWKHLEGGYKPSPIAARAEIQKDYLRMKCKLCGAPRYENNRYFPFDHFEDCSRYTGVTPQIVRFAKFATLDARKS